MTDKPQFVGERVHVSEVFDLCMGKTPSRKNPAYWQNGNHDWVSIADLSSFDKFVGKTKERINDFGVRESGIKPAPANTILMSFKLSLGKTAITVDPVYTNEAIMAFVDKGTYPVDVNFMYHQCKVKDWSHGTNAAVKGKTLNKKILGNATIWLPSLDEQRRVAYELDFVDRQIEQAERQIERLDSLVKSRFVEMFGDLSSYEAKTLRECVTGIESGNSPKCLTRPRIGNEPAVLKLSALSSGTYREEENKALPSDVEIREEKEVVDGDILLARKNTPELVGRSVLVNHTAGNIMFPDIVFRMHVRGGINEVFLSHVLANPLFGSIRSFAHGSAKSMSNIPKSELAKLAVPLPPLSFQQEFADFAAQVDKSRFIEMRDMLKALYAQLVSDLI